MPDHQTTAEPASGRTSVALVTGASAGLGREIARQLVLGRGMTVLATARRMDRLEALRDELPAGSVAILGGDLADPAFRDRSGHTGCRGGSAPVGNRGNRKVRGELLRLEVLSGLPVGSLSTLDGRPR